MNDMLSWVQTEWEKDAIIDRDNPAPLAVDQLHSKYWKLLSRARIDIVDLTQELAVLKVRKEQYFLHPTQEEATATKWIFPAHNKILKTEVKKYLDADPQILDLDRKINILDIRISFLEDVIKKIHNRGYLIKSHIDWEKFKNGVI